MKTRSKPNNGGGTYEEQIEALVAENQELMAKSDEIRARKLEIKDKINALATKEKARRILEDIPEDQRELFVKGVTAEAKIQANTPGSDN